MLTRTPSPDQHHPQLRTTKPRSRGTARSSSCELRQTAAATQVQRVHAVCVSWHGDAVSGQAARLFMRCTSLSGCNSQTQGDTDNKVRAASRHLYLSARQFKRASVADV